MESRIRTFAVVSDIHGNLPALNAVLEDAKSRGIGEFIFAGDYCLSGPFPDECIAALMSALPYSLDFRVNGVKIHLAHKSSTWTGDCEFRLIGPDVLAKRYEGKDVTPAYYRQDVQNRFRRDPSFQDALQTLEEGVYLFGHSHVQWNWQDTDRKIFLINPGSCGLPLDFISGSVPYTVLSVSESGEVSVEEIRVPFDKQGYAEVLRNSEQFREANVWTKVISKEWLKTHEHMTFFLEFAEQYAQEIGDPRRPFAVDTWETAYEIWNNRLPDATDQSNKQNL